MSYDPAEYEAAKERGYVTPEDMERWTGTDRSTWWRRWWLSPDGFSRWDNFKARMELWVADNLAREQPCGCRSLFGRKLVWCFDHLRRRILNGLDKDA